MSVENTDCQNCKDLTDKYHKLQQLCAMLICTRYSFTGDEKQQFNMALSELSNAFQSVGESVEQAMQASKEQIERLHLMSGMEASKSGIILPDKYK